MHRHNATPTIISILTAEVGKGRTLRDLAESIGDVSHEALRLIMKGTRTPSAKMAKKICAALNIETTVSEQIIADIVRIKHDKSSEELVPSGEEQIVAELLGVFEAHAARAMTPELALFLQDEFARVLARHRS